MKQSNARLAMHIKYVARLTAQLVNRHATVMCCDMVEHLAE